MGRTRSVKADWRRAVVRIVGTQGPFLAVAGGLGWLRGRRGVDLHGYAALGHEHGAARLVLGEVAHALALAGSLAAVLALLALPWLRRGSGARFAVSGAACQLALLPALAWLWMDWRVVRVRWDRELPALLWRTEQLESWGLFAGGVLAVAVVASLTVGRRAARPDVTTRGPRIALAVGALGLALAPLPLLAAWLDVRRTAPTSVAPANVLWLTWDSTRADHLSVYGYARPTTPGLERFAEVAVVYEQNYSQHNWTRPSYATMFTSLHQFEMRTDGLEPPVSTLAEELRDAGFATVAFVQNPNLDPELGFDQGFDRFVQLHHDVHATDVAERVVREIDALAGRARPFFVFAHMQQPHWPYVVGGPYAGLFGAAPEAVVDERKIEKLMRHRVEYWDAGSPEAEVELDWLLDMYDADTRLADEGVSRILEHLRATGLLSTTVVAFNSDHGDEFLDRGDFGHGHDNLHPELTRVPLIVHYPDAVAAEHRIEPHRTRTLTQNLDVFPTLLDAAGLAVPPHVSGRSLLRLAPDDADRRPVFSLGARRAVVRRGERSLVCDEESGERWYFDRAADAGEWTPLRLDDADEELASLNAIADALVEKRRSAMSGRPEPVSEELEGRLRDLGYL